VIPAPGAALTAATFSALAAVDLLPVGSCPKHDWMILDVAVLSDGMLIRCPVCWHRFRVTEVTFCDDIARRRHGLILTESE
jgi:hypothetical protein